MSEQGPPLIYGEVLFDCFDDGSTVLGGAPFNVAWHLQAFGLCPLLISRVGDDPLARRIRGAMDQWGMNTAGLQMDSAHETGRVEVELRDGEPAYEIIPDTAYDHIQREVIPPLAPSLIYHGTLALRRPESAATLRYIRDRYNVPVFLDVNLRPPFWNSQLLDDCMQGATWLKINEHELDVLAGSGEVFADKVRSLIKRYQISLVILTRGAEGAVAISAEGEIAEARPQGGTAVVDTVGAGDAFSSVCILGLTSGWAITLTLERAQSFASMVVARRGATISDPAPYRLLLEQWGFDTGIEG